MRYAKALILAVVVVVATLAIVAAAKRRAAAPATPPGPDVMKLAQGNNEFGMDLYWRLSEKPGNLFISPYSIQTALLMTWAGAKGPTAKEMYAAMHLPVTRTAEHLKPVKGLPQPWLDRKEPWPAQQINDAAASWIRGINAIGQAGDVKLDTANAVWTATDLLDDYVKLLADNYGAKAQDVKFPEPGRSIINDWVAKKTNDRIKDLIKLPDVQGPVALVLTNAIYFKGDWECQFEKKLTQDEPFHVSPDKTVSAAMMHRSGEYGYYQTPLIHDPNGAAATAQLLELPYKGDRLSMVIILPDSAKPESLRAVEGLLAGRLDGWLKAMHETHVDVRIPRWKMNWRGYLGPTLQNMGMKLAFTGSADFSGMDGKHDLFIGLVIHQSFVEVNEEGTEAAAATAVVMERAGVACSVEFRADRPFVFLIRDKVTGAILFVGRLAQPEK